MAAISLRSSGRPSASLSLSSIGIAGSCQGNSSSCSNAAGADARAVLPGIEPEQSGEETIEPGALLGREGCTLGEDGEGHEHQPCKTFGESNNSLSCSVE